MTVFNKDLKDFSPERPVAALIQNVIGAGIVLFALATLVLA
jgi:hypothetical protein